MSIIKKVFQYEENKISIIMCNDEIWFRGKSVAQSLGYLKPLKALHTHVDKEDKRKLSDLEGVPQNGVHLRLGVTQNGVHLNLQSGCLFINESGLYSLILRSKLESALAFKRWVTKDVLPSIRKTCRYSYNGMNHKYNNPSTFKIENETDLHVKVVSFLKKRYPNSLFNVTLGENQDTVHKRIDSFKKRYLRGSPDLVINNLHKHYTGFCIESPKRNGVLSPDQSMILLQYQNNGFKTLMSNDYDHIIKQIIEYFRDVRIKCSYCPRRFISPQSLRNHIKSFHKR